MDNKEFAKQLESRTKKFALSIIRISSSLPYTAEYNVIKNQITKSSTSIGANYREANRSRNKADFVNKIKICESEANETVYWLEIISELKAFDSEKVKISMKESTEILAIFTTISTKLKLK